MLALPQKTWASELSTSMQPLLCRSSCVLRRLLHHQIGFGVLEGHARQMVHHEPLKSHQLQSLHQRTVRQRSSCRGQNSAVYLCWRGLFHRRAAAGLASESLHSRKSAARNVGKRERRVRQMYRRQECGGQRCLQMQCVRSCQTYPRILDDLLPPVSAGRTSCAHLEVHGLSVS